MSRTFQRPAFEPPRSAHGAKRSVWDDALPRIGNLLAPFLVARRWFGGKGRRMTRARLVDRASVRGAEDALLAIVEVVYADRDGESERYFVPLAATYGEHAGPSPPLLRYGGVTVHDAFEDERFCRALLRAIARGAEVATARGGTFAFSTSAGPRPSQVDPRTAVVRLVGGEQSNTSVVYDEALLFKAYRRLGLGTHPEIELLRFLADQANFDQVPTVAGWGEYRAPDRPPMAIGVLQAFVPNEGDGWTWTLQQLGPLARAPVDQFPADGAALEAVVAARTADHLAGLAELGRVTAELHLALSADPTGPLAPEPIAPADLEAWRSAGVGRLATALGRLRERLAEQPEAVRVLGDEALEHEARLRETLGGLGALAEGAPGRPPVKTRHHGDYHLGQVLKTAESWVILDFEGEPLRPLAERRARHTPLKDVAGLLRSLNYARHAAERARSSALRPQGGHVDAEKPSPGLVAWERLARRAFLESYLARARAGGARFLPRSDDAIRRALAALELDKAVYELEYELDNRPDWLAIPLAALADSASIRP